MTTTTSTEGATVVYEWWYFWPYHGPTIPAQTVDWEPVFVYVDVGKGALVGIAYRQDFKWILIQRGFTVNGGGRAVITFSPAYHVPSNSYPAQPNLYAQSINYTYSVGLSGTETLVPDPWFIYHQPKNFTTATIYGAAATALTTGILYALFYILSIFKVPTNYEIMAYNRRANTVRSFSRGTLSLTSRLRSVQQKLWRLQPSTGNQAIVVA